MERQSNYKPRKSGFPYKLLQYLYEKGTSEGVIAQEEIGLNKWADRKGSIYYNRASTNFDAIVSGLHKRGLIKLLENDYYELTKVGKEFIRTYKKR